MRIRKETDEMPESEVMLMAKISDALAHPARIKIFRYIMNCNKKIIPVCNKGIVDEFDYAQATISQHMKTLVKSGLVDVRKEEKFSYYFVNIGMLMKYLDATKRFE
ncbi:MAG TPA: metalloregulator ArsR/SmtB family transcription factor [Bacillota bacterium]|nr:metalloregulator ArsR/SmtB family transcription factor [Bacillota bacterium]HUM55765.1 metalloregulator ArsR/SmtB family transcription factor [Bacillota bacterium]